MQAVIKLLMWFLPSTSRLKLPTCIVSKFAKRISAAIAFSLPAIEISEFAMFSRLSAF